jgi:gamma-glutamylcyclotransferase (GGCT)/AIG2-like uncharacterized protein YtfP
MKYPFFVYGTLRPGHGNYAHLLAGQTDREAPAVLHDALMFTNGGYPYVITHPNLAGNTVKGDLVWVSDDIYANVMDSLDALEGTNNPNSRDHGTNHYDRVVATVHTDAGPETAWLYTPNSAWLRDVLSMPLVEGGDWSAASRRRAVSTW